MATVKNYGGRNGIATIIFLAHRVCLIVGVFKTPMTQWINGSSDITEPNKALIINWINVAGDVCAALETAQVRYEK
jgi:hypothetical protein